MQPLFPFLTYEVTKTTVNYKRLVYNGVMLTYIYIYNEFYFSIKFLRFLLLLIMKYPTHRLLLFDVNHTISQENLSHAEILILNCFLFPPQRWLFYRVIKTTDKLVLSDCRIIFCRPLSDSLV
jgi:hypothetical protein